MRNWYLHPLVNGKRVSLRQRRKYAGEIWKRSFIFTVRPTVYANPSWKRSFISTVRPTVHANPSWKRSFISTVRPTVHTNPSWKRSFISTVRPTVHTNPSRKRSFSKKRFSYRKEFENAGALFWKQCSHDNHACVISLTVFSSSINPELP